MIKIKQVTNKRTIYTVGAITAGVLVALHLFFFLNKNPAGMQIAIAFTIVVMCLFDVFTKDHIIPKTLTVSIAVYGIAINIRHPLFFILPIGLDFILLLLFARAGFGMGDFKAFVALSFLMSNNEFFWLYIATFTVAAIIAVAAVIKKKTFAKVKKAFLSISGILVYDEEDEGMPFMPFVLIGYIIIIIANFFVPVW